MPQELGLPPPDRTRIVIADDDPFFAALLQANLSECPGLDVVGTAANGAEAVSLVEELRPEFVLLDVNMPVLGGIEATRQIRELEDPPAVVLLTGEDTEGDLGSYEAGAVAILRKSLEHVMLIEVIVALSRFAAV